MPNDIEKLKYPIGKDAAPKRMDAKLMRQWRTDIARFPYRLRQICEGLSKTQLQWLYRPNGWTLAQVVHHCADSHMQAFIRFKLALTEENPTIRPYIEARWAETEEAKSLDLLPTLQILEGLHQHWQNLLEELDEHDFNRCYFHPEHNAQIRLWHALASYAWHCNHHLAHVKQALNAEGKYN